MKFQQIYNQSIENPEEFFENEISILLEKKGLNPKKHLSGFMLETYQGWGAIFYPKEFIKTVNIETCSVCRITHTTQNLNVVSSWEI